MNVLVACEYSGVVRDAFIARGHQAISCDLLDTEKPGPHYKGNVLDILYEEWDLIIAHPPCTYLCNSGVRWLHERKQRWIDMRYAADFFNLFLNHPHCKKIGIENPVMHRYGLQIIGRKPNMTFQPWEFGHKEIKRTCLWLRGLPLLRPTNIVGPRPPNEPYGEWAKVHYEKPGPDQWKNRSRTYAGVADAMAEQWTNPNNYRYDLFGNLILTN
jgi:hypothetical protein